MTIKHPNWRCPGCGEVMYYRGACHHAYAAMIILVARSTGRPNTGHRACGRSTGHESGSSKPAARPPKGVRELHGPRGLAMFEPVAVRV